MITELKSQMLDVQIRGMKNNITVSGIPETPNENAVTKFNEFVVNQLLIKDKLIPVESAVRLGFGRSRPLLVTLRHSADKSLIFDHVSNLKGKKVNGIQCFVSSHLPEAANEKRRQINTAMSENKQRPVHSKLPLTVKYGKLHCGGQPVLAKVHPPTSSELTRLIDPEIDQLNNLKIIRGSTEDKEESTFIGYATSTTSLDDVRAAYKRLRLMHGQATHIACAYSLQAGPVLHREGGCDDEEYGAARVLRGILADKQVNNVTVFLVRYYGGNKLGAARFDLMKQVVQDAITAWTVSLQAEQDPAKEEEWRKGLAKDNPPGWGDEEQQQHSEDDDSTEAI